MRVATAITTLPQSVESGDRHLGSVVTVTMSPPRNTALAEAATMQQAKEQQQQQVNQQGDHSNHQPQGDITRTHARSSRDYIFGKMVGEGSFSTVYLCKDIHSGKEFAIKVCDKRHIIREMKTANVKRERDILNLLSSNLKPTAPFFVKLYCTFQDADRLYYVLSYAKNGELLPYINRVGSFDFNCTQFYAAEIVQALEFLHGLGIIHRDLKPENILLDENMHILITDFGSAKILRSDSNEEDPPSPQRQRRRRNSFDGTAQYVSPELLTDKSASKSSDLWALGCIVYQMVAGLPPFRSRSEYLIFQSILKLEYDFPDGFDPLAKKFVQDLLILDPSKRLGSNDKEGYPSIKSHVFFEGIDFDTLHEQTAPQIYPYLPGTSQHEELRSHYRVPDNLEPGLDDKQLTRLLGLDLQDATCVPFYVSSEVRDNGTKEVKERKTSKRKTGILDMTADEIQRKTKEQKKNSQWHSLVSGHLILKQGLIDKRKGLFSRRRMLLLTVGPHLYYVDPVNMVLKGEIPWSPELRVEPKNFKIFFVHTNLLSVSKSIGQCLTSLIKIIERYKPNRTYYLEDPEGYALEWCRVIEEVRIHTYGLQQ